MNFNSKLRILALTAIGFSIIANASAQVSPPTLKPTLEPTIKVYPAPTVKTEQPAGTVQRQCVCTAQYDPVCARTRDGKKATYSNACKARCVDATVVARGAC